MLNLKEYIPASLIPGSSKTPAQSLPFKGYDEYLQLIDGTYRCILKVSAINNDLLADDENDAIVEYTQEAINSIQSGLSQITVSSERLNLDEYIEYLEEKHAATNESYFLERLDAMIEYVKRTSVRQRTTKSFYFTVVSRSTEFSRAQEEFDEAMRKIEDALGAAEIMVKRLNKMNGMRMLYEKLNPNSSVTQPFNPEIHNNFESIAPVPIIHHEYHSEMDGMYFKFFTITDYPDGKLSAGWMSKIFNVNAEVDVSIILQETGKKKMIDSIDHSVGMIRYQLNKAGTKESEKIEFENKENSAREMLKDLSSDAEKIFNVTMVIAVRERNLKQLEISCERVQTAISSSKMHARQLFLMNNDLFWLSLPIAYMSPFLKNTNMYWPMQSSIIGSILPFNSSDFLMTRGVVMGRNPATNSLIISDRRDKKKADNPNMVVIAPSGRGKSWFAKTNISRENSQGTKCIIIDPDREYKFKVGERVVFSIGSPFCTNPFHIRSAILDIDEEEEEEENDSRNYVENVGQYLQRKIGDLIPFFRGIYPAMDSTEEADLMEAIQIMYKEKANLTFTSTELPTIFPTLSDINQVISREEFGDSLAKFKKNLRPYVTGIYSGMFNGQTNWSMDSMLTVLDINSLSDVIQPQMMYLLLQDIWEYCKKDRNEQKALYVDEAWKLADPDNPQTLKFMFEISKRIRKYGGFLTPITQSVQDFFSAGKGNKNYGQAIFDNAFFKVFLGLSENDYKALTDIGFTFSRKEERILKRRKAKGRGVFIAGSNRVEIATTPLVDELQFIDMAEYKKVKGFERGMDYTEIDTSA